MEGLAGKVAVVTGAGSGIGRATVLSFARRGMRVVVADIDGNAAAETVDLIVGGDALAVQTDVADLGAIERLRDETLDRFGGVHVVHNNAGVLASGLVDEISLDLWRWVIDVDLWSVIHGVRVFAPLLSAQGEGHIVNTASTAGLQANAGIGPYNVAKFGVVALSETARLELAPRGVGVSVLCPGPVNTRIVDAERNLPDGIAPSSGAITDQFTAGAAASLAAGLDPAEVAEMVVDGIMRNRFWILTHPEWVDRLAVRVEQMRDGVLEHGSNG